jgi:hypothetical protein
MKLGKSAGELIKQYDSYKAMAKVLDNSGEDLDKKLNSVDVRDGYGHGFQANIDGDRVEICDTTTWKETESNVAYYLPMFCKRKEIFVGDSDILVVNIIEEKERNYPEVDYAVRYSAIIDKKNQTFFKENEEKIRSVWL